MADKTIVQKALAYVLNDRDELLVFRHVDFPWEQTGLQVPGGTVRSGETPAQAVLREAHEETGLTGLALQSKLGEALYDISPLRPEIQHRHFYYLTTNDSSPQRWSSAELHDGLLPPTRLECFWLPLRYAHALASGQGALISHLPQLLQAQTYG